MNLEFDQEQNILRDTARNFMRKECPPSIMRQMRESPESQPPGLWQKMAEMGWLGVMIPEQYGGFGGSFLDLAIILEAMGEVCYTGPYFSTVVLGTLPILKAGSEEQKRDLLPKIVEGKLILALAVMEPDSGCFPAPMHTTAAAAKGGYMLSGTKIFVENAHVADYILCAARTGEGEDPEQNTTLLLVDAKSAGVRPTLLKNLAYERQCEVVFDEVLVPENCAIGPVGGARELLRQLEEVAAVAKCMEMVGGMQTAFEMTVTYAKEREQFGRPIGSFQAVQHHCANMVTDLDGARFLTYQAAWRISQGLPAAMEASMAKAWTSRASQRVTTLAHQIHGAVAFCDEHDLHLFYRKAKAGEVAFGDGQYHLEKVVRQLGL